MWNSAVVVKADDLAESRVEALCRLPFAPVARRDVEHPVRTERHAMAVVTLAGDLRLLRPYTIYIDEFRNVARSLDLGPRHDGTALGARIAAEPRFDPVRVRFP